MKSGALLLAAALLLAPGAAATPAELRAALPQAQLLGAARFAVFGISIFDAELYGVGETFNWRAPFALSLTYRKRISDDALVARSIDEMAERSSVDAAALAPLRRQLDACFTDVAPSDRFTAVSDGDDSARFYFNGALRCSVQWPGFRRAFFGIWLEARDAGFARRLRGEA